MEKSNKLIQCIIGASFLNCGAILLGVKYFAVAVRGYWGTEAIDILIKQTPITLNVIIYSTFAMGILFIVLALLDKSKPDKG